LPGAEIIFLPGTGGNGNRLLMTNSRGSFYFLALLVVGYMLLNDLL
jgi:hypothetical protein